MLNLINIEAYEYKSCSTKYYDFQFLLKLQFLFEKKN